MSELYQLLATIWDDTCLFTLLNVSMHGNGILTAMLLRIRVSKTSFFFAQVKLDLLKNFQQINNSIILSLSDTFLWTVSGFPWKVHYGFLLQMLSLLPDALLQTRCSLILLHQMAFFQINEIKKSEKKLNKPWRE